MKINNLKINGYGKISDKELNLNDNINIIHGKNETGKSTTLSFINSMFYGASKNKNGKNISNFDKYRPWKTNEFSGKIKYTLDNGKQFEIYRDFKKKNPIIYDDNLNDISSNYNVDKSSGIDFLNEQIGIDESIFSNTVITYQDEIKIDKAGQNSIIQKISNLISSGDETVSFKKTLDKINKLQNEQVGTNRTVQKPINIIDNNIKKLSKEKEELENYKELVSQNEINFNNLEDKIKDESIKFELLKKYKEIIEKNKIDYAEIDVNKDVELSYDKKIEELKNKVDSNSKEQIQKENKSFKSNYILIFIITIIAIITAILGKIIVVPIILGFVDLIILVKTIFDFVKFSNQKKDKLKEIEELENKINHEIEFLNKSKDERKKQRIEKEAKIKEKIRVKNQELKNEFKEEIDNEFIDDVFNMNYDETAVCIQNKEERLNELKLQYKSKENEREIMNSKLENLSKIQEELENALEEKNELNSLNNSFNIAKECIEIAYEKVRENLSPIFTNELCNLVNKISDGKYSNVKFSDTEGLVVEIDDGRYYQVENLSIGTIDQMYLALRFSSLQTISKEDMPIILDEAFVYFDDDRLKNILLFINENYNNKQVIIFTCSNREKETLDKLKLPYNLIELES